MNALRMRLRFFLITLLVVLVVGVVGSMHTEQLSLTDAFYFTVVTVATVGYGDVTPKSASGKMLAIFLIVMGVGTFLGVVGNAIELMLTRREHASRLEKLNMVIGAFFSEVGSDLLRRFSAANPHAKDAAEQLRVNAKWTDRDFAKVRAHLAKQDYKVDVAKVDLEALADTLAAQREFMVRLLENPALLEHESFTNILWAVFHLTEELCRRDDRSALPESDRLHLAGDMNRAYGLLVAQWLRYMEHLRAKYPYLFSLAVRTNPFDPEASPIVQ